MKAEILSIGSEITTGQNLDTNSQWLSLRLAELGIPVGFHTTVADDFDDNVAVFRAATERASLIIATGGLGPTQDDLTREVLARLAGVDLVEDPESLRHIQDMFARRKRLMPERNRVQALCPRGAEVLFNSCGTAPGIWMKLGDTLVACMPGVPSEMRVMFEEQVKPRLIALGFAAGIQVQRKINTFGTGESHIEEKLFDLTRRGHVPEVGITASDATISLRIFGRGTTLEEALAQILPIEKTIVERLGKLVYGADHEELEDSVIRLLGEKHRTLASAESVTGGRIGARLTRVPGASLWYRGGIIAYDNRIKVEWLAVPQSLIDDHGVISPAVVEAMAVGCRTRMKTDIAVATVGVAGPGMGNSETPVGQVYVGLAWEGGVASSGFSWLGTREEIQNRTAKMALNVVRLHLL